MSVITDAMKLTLLVAFLVCIFVFTVRQGFIDSTAQREGGTMQFTMVSPLRIAVNDQITPANYCSEKMCREKPTHYTLIMALDHGMSFMLWLCAKHTQEAKQMRTCSKCGAVTSTD